MAVYEGFLVENPAMRVDAAVTGRDLFGLLMGTGQVDEAVAVSERVAELMREMHAEGQDGWLHHQGPGKVVK
ncbi:hypothetical protein [Actinomadura sp. BRA 177]|uniref:hypothetical protein n=1 Tax=Actinomadura sp. BRA 177 TaxID=2745202 RepID=UPI0015952937|nr:hypothetical protein [Actinomadura sp. BRA 177]NVI85758.1 hypothetical protein [Actinomadura sp. BRA 177]